MPITESNRIRSVSYMASYFNNAANSSTAGSMQQYTYRNIYYGLRSKYGDTSTELLSYNEINSMTYNFIFGRTNYMAFLQTNNSNYVDKQLVPWSYIKSNVKKITVLTNKLNCVKWGPSSIVNITTANTHNYVTTPYTYSIGYTEYIDGEAVMPNCYLYLYPSNRTERYPNIKSDKAWFFPSNIRMDMAGTEPSTNGVTFDIKAQWSKPGTTIENSNNDLYNALNWYSNTNNISYITASTKDSSNMAVSKAYALDVINADECIIYSYHNGPLYPTKRIKVGQSSPVEIMCSGHSEAIYRRLTVETAYMGTYFGGSHPYYDETVPSYGAFDTSKTVINYDNRELYRLNGPSRSVVPLSFNSATNSYWKMKQTPIDFPGQTINSEHWKASAYFIIYPWKNQPAYMAYMDGIVAYESPTSLTLTNLLMENLRESYVDFESGLELYVNPECSECTQLLLSSSNTSVAKNPRLYMTPQHTVNYDVPPLTGAHGQYILSDCLNEIYREGVFPIVLDNVGPGTTNVTATWVHPNGTISTTYSGLTVTHKHYTWFGIDIVGIDYDYNGNDYLLMNNWNEDHVYLQDYTNTTNPGIPMVSGCKIRMPVGLNPQEDWDNTQRNLVIGTFILKFTTIGNTNYTFKIPVKVWNRDDSYYWPGTPHQEHIQIFLDFGNAKDNNDNPINQNFINYLSNSSFNAWDENWSVEENTIDFTLRDSATYPNNHARYIGDVSGEYISINNLGVCTNIACYSIPLQLQVFEVIYNHIIVQFGFDYSHVR